MADAGAVRGLYAITDATLQPADALLERAEAVLRGGAAVLQYRDKSQDTPRRRREAAGLLALCRDYGALFVVNDDVDLALYVGAPAVHLGRDDAGLRQARTVLPSGTLIGVSCYNSLARADTLAAAGADYLAFGRAYPSPTKPDAPPVSRDTLAAAVARYRQPVVAIGGITPENAQPLVSLGVDAVAVISGVFAAASPERAAARLAALYH
ncbi:thiamine phosphate synthase [Aquisalimonas asiatica]|uniref:Thiamine-phosphate synthase n=1 Tax=Aquisalimonas asiatica TaxID=406100 RepID=A0A1H8TR54_9GAMM|nr:thiamine phosphate synthase [Aquisalimonas asiatica]SEO93510.1 thiamine-phosphate diphosphorylase [Aquisalimonas asiatica]